jgi:hypothetical protein
MLVKGKPGVFAARYDPTRTTPIVNQWMKDINYRLGLFQKAIQKTVVEQNHFGLRSKLKVHGGAGSGNFGHVGRPGQRGGSAKGVSEDPFPLQSLIRSTIPNASTGSVVDYASAALATSWNPDASALQKLLKEEGINGGKEEFVWHLLKKWQSSSGGDVVIAMVGGLTTVPAAWQNAWFDKTKTREILESLGRAMYDSTQKWFQEQGVTHVRLYRKGSTLMRPFTSWSTSLSGVRHEGGGEYHNEVVPVSRIWSIPSTGFGTLAESEVVVLGSAPKTLKTNAPYAFATSAEKLTAFTKWVQEQSKLYLLSGGQDGYDVVNGPPMSIHGNDTWWASKYLISGYKKGMTRAAQEMRKAGLKEYKNIIFTEDQPIETGINALFNMPIHADRARLLFTRTYEDLKGVTDSMSRKMGQVMADAVIAGDAPDTVAKEMYEILDGNKARARMIARTEIIRAHNTGSINTYRQAGIDGVEVVAEVITVAGGKAELYDALHVCPDCQELEERSRKKPLSLEEAEVAIPVHPNCRCMTIPRVIRIDGEPSSSEEEQGELPLDET